LEAATVTNDWNYKQSSARDWAIVKLKD